MSTIRELRILPPLAIGRLGASKRPVDNYEAVVDPRRPLGYRGLVATETLELDEESGEITRIFRPEELTFSDGDGVRPVAPFLELWAVTGDDVMEPVTLDLLARAGLAPSDVRWDVRVGNIKAFRRTGDPLDRVEARQTFTDHARRPLDGTCQNFWPGSVLPLGHVQYVKPTPAFPEVRLRFTPGPGAIYGSSRTPPQDTDPDHNGVRPIYDANRGRWPGYEDPAGDPRNTVPGDIFAGTEGSGGVSIGYLDDECDGLVHVSLTVDGDELTAYARIGAGPPAYAPDSFPVRTVHDELEQWMHGVRADPADVSLERVEEIIRRAFETIRLMNAAVMNGNVVGDRVAAASTMVRQDTGDTGRAYEPIMATSLVDTQALEHLHENLLVALRGGSAPWFVDVLRKYDEIGDLSDKGRRKMPAMMRNADGRALALTRRQVDIVRQAAQGPIFPDDPA